MPRQLMSSISQEHILVELPRVCYNVYMNECKICGTEVNPPYKSLCSPECRLKAYRQYQKQQRTKYNHNPRMRQRINCRNRTRLYSKMGYFKETGVCAECGLPAECKHHPDYNNFKLFIELCNNCHQKIDPSLVKPNFVFNSWQVFALRGIILVYKTPNYANTQAQ